MPILGLSEFEAALKRVAADAERAGKEAVAKTAAIAEAGAKANFKGSHAKGQPHVGGDKPNVVTGAARRSIRTDPIHRYGLADYGTVVAPRLIYTRRLELGYPGNSSGGPGHQKTGAFPFFEEPARLARARFRSIADDTWAKFLRA